MLLTIQNIVLAVHYRRTWPGDGGYGGISILKALGFALGAREAAATATQRGTTLRGRLRHGTAAMRASTLLTCWHGQKASGAPRSNVACLSTREGERGLNSAIIALMLR